MFWRMPQRDVVSWSTMITACTRNGHDNEALELFRQMQLEDVQQDKITFICILDACTHLGALEKGQEIHAAIVNIGYQRDTLAGTALINMYGKCGRVDNAKGVFGTMYQRDVVCWSAILTACAQNGRGKEALDLFYQMQLEGIKPNKISLICVLDSCASVGMLEEGKKIHAYIIDSGYGCDVVVATALIGMYGRCRSLDDARTVFRGICQRDLISWSNMIAACVLNDHGKEALEVFHQMCVAGFEPNIVTFICVLDACALLASVKDAEHVHAAIVSSGCEQDVFVGNALINMYTKCGDLDNAMNAFHKMPQPDVVSWSAMIAACSQHGHDNDALELFWQMQLGHIEPDNITFLCVLDACTSLVDRDAGHKIHTAIVEGGYEQCVVIGTALIKMYGSCESPEDAGDVFYRIPQHDVASWTAMITAFAQNGHSNEALEHFYCMGFRGMKPDKVSFVCVLDACASLAMVELQAIHVAIIENGYEVDVSVGNSLVSMYGKCGSVDDAKSVFTALPERDVVSWTAMITACAQNGKGKEALEYYLQMQLEGIKPNKITFMVVLSACSHSGWVKNGRYFFNSMKFNHGMTPTVQHQMCMIDLLGRAGHLDEAEDLVNDVNRGKDAEAWLSLLASCRIHGDVERGVRAANSCFELDPVNSVPYIMLSNIYAAAGRWDDVASVRATLENMCVKQEGEGQAQLYWAQSSP